MVDKWVNTTPALPIVSDFNTTSGQGSPICVDQSTSFAYMLINNGIVPIGSALTDIPTRTALAGFSSTLHVVYLSEPGREGWWRYNSANISASCSGGFAYGDTQQGLFVLPTSDTSGASGVWTRIYSGLIDVRWFGAVADCTAFGAGTDNSPAIQGVIDYLYKKGGAFYIPDGKYRCSTRLLIKSTVRILGTTTLQDSTAVGHPTAEDGTTLVFDAGVGGIRLSYVVDGDVSATPATNPGAAGTVIENLRLISGSAGAAAAGIYGFESRVRCILRNVELRGFGDHGFYIRASLSGGDGVVYGNASKSMLDNCRSIGNAGNGFFISGNDANVINVMGCHSQVNTLWGFRDDSFIGTQYWGCLTEGNNSGGWKVDRAPSPCIFLGCEDEGATSVLAASCIVLGSTLGQKYQGQALTAWGRVGAYSGLTVHSGNTIQLNNAADAASVNFFYDGTNVLFNAPLKIAAAGIAWSGSLSTLVSDGTNLTANSPLRSTIAIGYATGAGGTVTQVTSRTTGVTLNKACGQITLVSAAGLATWQTFTVTNSQVAATDVIRVVQASGTDLYQIMVTKVVGGSFNISFATTGGTTTEQPVFNFAVIKAVNA